MFAGGPIGEHDLADEIGSVTGIGHSGSGFFEASTTDRWLVFYHTSTGWEKRLVGNRGYAAGWMDNCIT